MSLMTYLFLYSVIVLHKFLINGELTTEECTSLGYVKTQLMCSSCEQLAEFGLDELKPNCLQCCQKDNVAGSTAEKRYPKAVLEVCTCKFGAYPQIQAFVKSERPAKFPNLTIKYVRGLDPMVKLMDKNGHVQETLSIAKWNTDTVQEFFETVLETTLKDDDNNNKDDDYLKTNMV